MTPIDIVVLVLVVLLVAALIVFLVRKSKQGPCSFCAHKGGKRLYKSYRKAHPRCCDKPSETKEKED